MDFVKMTRSPLASDEGSCLFALLSAVQRSETGGIFQGVESQFTCWADTHLIGFAMSYFPSCVP